MAKHRLNRYLPAVFLSLLLLACSQSPSPWHGHDISGMMPALAFHLIDSSGQPVDATRYAGKLTLLYFGFTHCQNVCPVTLTTLGMALRRLGNDAQNVRILFVSVDPHRDTPTVLHRYTSHFAPQVEGLTGTQAELQALSKRYRISYSYSKPGANGDYAVYHSSAIFVFDGSGRIRLLVNVKEGATAISEDLKRLLAG